MMLKDTYGSWALVAGAAEGLGEAYSRSIAKRGMNLIMVDHKPEEMDLLAIGLESEYGISTRRLQLDLGADNAVELMRKEIEETSCRMILYNAAYSKVKRFSENSAADLDSYVAVNMRTPIQLVHNFVQFHRGNIQERKGIILMSSMAGSWGTGMLAPYGATKAFNRILAEALHSELKPNGFDVMVCVAGATATPAYLGTNPQYGRIKPHVMKPEAVSEEVLHFLGKKAVFVPGWRNRVAYFLLNRILSRRMAVGMFNKTVGEMYRNLM
ncbi:SDR family NAD(P)-dependent oxidoreductase [Bacteroidota bacterium]